MNDELPSFLEEGAAADLHGWKKAAGRLARPPGQLCNCCRTCSFYHCLLNESHPP